MKKLVLIAVLIAVLELTHGAPRTAPTRLGGRTPQYLRTSNRNGRIVGGEPADIERFPHMLALLDLSWGGFICGASVIHAQWSLTAAHCLEFDTPAIMINLRGGSSSRVSGGFLFFVDSYTLHPQYDTDWLDFDIAIIRVADDSPLTGLNVAVVPISPICDSACCQTCDPEPVTITGWGIDDNGVIPQLLNQITLPIYNHAECDTKWGWIPEFFFCVWAGNGQDSCNGDSGSPLVRDVNGQRFQIGLVSFGSSTCGDGSFPSVNTRIEYPGVRNWITEVSGL
ncbi:trypsin 3A1-like [Chironomus tepperi]|uniref:trypsin 3A1-like n=1 Tax=Chironomus tepperi TaxID=113505 RepID=UPI00391F76A3